jgi:uncharacterized membrane protein
MRADRRWAELSTVVLSGIGLALSAYLSVEHYRAPGTLACPATATVNCTRVTTSAQSTLFGVPVALLGVAFFAAMLLVCLPMAWRDARLTRVRFALTGVGVGFVIYLVYAELFLVDALCLWCTAVHLVALALFVVVVFVTAGASTHTGRDALGARLRR